ncbi:hypothetical protein CH253_08935 [Rhodococcus sp. 06-156-3C]|uniref:hypothetical protein n=1 Tax=Nocardiaceae TaxID=85025 RepID=UPI000522E7E7|nr:MULTISPECIES: hypothetical protein [Rhodococcus]OZD14735.1 hypothetical protein CH280_10565 [Rhodococcus sp. 06-156-4C]OZD20190.1 hypothetical protein CH248_16270 [Rhodococcus sp. 06-156-4a]OZD22507.1 hypothetical protein CH253_08935 [Rhodococcus sp. 06-156-3C]OZD26207.1 hypothetical protein CH247_27050 [Rhodococcus sp. 06-156-3b]OZD38415.1 hypothetical protein CH284_10800 [Rhodococcus sp. 06-156-3]
MRLPGLALGFVPWALFLVMPHREGDHALLFSSILTALVALVLTHWTRGRAGIKWLGATAVLIFAGFAAASLVSFPSSTWLSEYASAIALFVLAAVMATSTLGVTFTEQYARESLPKEYWGAPRLRSLNVRISATWAVCTFAAALSMTVAAAVADPFSKYFALAWIVPVCLTLFASRYTATSLGALTSRA